MKSSEPHSEALQANSVAVPKNNLAGTAAALPQKKRRSLRQPPVRQNGTSLSAEDIANLSRLAAALQAVMPAPTSSVPQDSSSGSGGPVTARTLTHEEAAIVTRALLNDEFRRLPKSANKKLKRPAEFCPRTGLNRNQLYELFDLRENGRPVIKSVSFKGPREKKGARLYNVGSVVEYLHRLAEIQAQAESAKT
jgi:hypothetical protein